jgi:hypothetical protein
MVLMGHSGARGTLIYEKNLKLKISCQTPLKNPQNHYKALSVHVSTDKNWTGGACKGGRVTKHI